MITNVPTTKSTDTESPNVASELQDHIEVVTQWSETIASLEVSECAKGVTDRFVRDCQTLINDCTAAENPSTDDLIDLKDSRDSLEIRHFNLIQDHTPLKEED